VYDDGFELRERGGWTTSLEELHFGMVGVLLKIPGAPSFHVSHIESQMITCGVMKLNDTSNIIDLVLCCRFGARTGQILYLTLQHIMTFHMPSRSTGISPM
jgi:hypothetical protein